MYEQVKEKQTYFVKLYRYIQIKVNECNYTQESDTHNYGYVN